MTRQANRDDMAIDVTSSSTPGPRETPVPAVILEADGLTCGVLEPLIVTHLRRLTPGEVLEIRSDGTEAGDGIGAWVSLTGHTLVAIEQIDDSIAGGIFFERNRRRPSPHHGSSGGRLSLENTRT